MAPPSSPPPSRLRSLQAWTVALLNEQPSHEDGPVSTLERVIQFFIFVIRSFGRNRCPVRASALAYTTLLALVPLLAVAISISTSVLKTDDGQRQVENAIQTLIRNVAPQLGLQPHEGEKTVQELEEDEDAARMVASKINAFIANVNSKTIGVTALAALLFVALSMLSTIESTLNDIWGVQRGRSIMSRVVQYWAAISLGPILLLSMLGFQASMNLDGVELFLKQVHLYNAFRYFLPAFVMSLAFTLFYWAMPNTRVEWRAALMGGLIGGFLWHLNNMASVLYIGQVVRNKEIYGSLGVIPVFLIGIYFSWLILLFGAQAAYAFQNRHLHLQERQAEAASQRSREFIALRMITHIARQFALGEAPPTATQLAERLAIPSRLVTRILEPMITRHIVLEVAGKDTGYCPARPLDKLTAADILDALRSGQGSEIPTSNDPSRLLAMEHFDRIRAAETATAKTIRLCDLAKLEDQVNPEQKPGNPVVSEAAPESLRSG